MRTLADIDELRQAVGSHVGRSSWHQIGQEVAGRFADAIGDRRWMHVDTALVAGEGSSGGTLAHAYLALSLIPQLAREVLRVQGLRIEINYGSNSVRFPAPLLVGSRVRAGVEIVRLEPLRVRHLYTYRITVEREGGDKPVCVIETLGYLVP